MIKAIIIDDESYIRTIIEAYVLKKFAKDIMVIGKADSVESSIELINNIQPDLLFLDIKLNDGTGFDILERITEKNINVIFITGYDHHAIKAIKVGALDYILKPIDEKELEIAILKAIEKFSNYNEISKHLEVSTEYFRGSKKKRIVLKTLDQIHFVFEDDILYCHSEGNYTTFHLKEGQNIIISKSLKKSIELLSDDLFIRCHQSHLVNASHVASYNHQGYLLLKSGEIVPVSGRLKRLVINQIF